MHAMGPGLLLLILPLVVVVVVVVVPEALLGRPMGPWRGGLLLLPRLPGRANRTTSPDWSSRRHLMSHSLVWQSLGPGAAGGPGAVAPRAVDERGPTTTTTTANTPMHLVRAFLRGLHATPEPASFSFTTSSSSSPSEASSSSPVTSSSASSSPPHPAPDTASSGESGEPSPLTLLPSPLLHTAHSAPFNSQELQGAETTSFLRPPPGIRDRLAHSPSVRVPREGASASPLPIAGLSPIEEPPAHAHWTIPRPPGRELPLYLGPLDDPLDREEEPAGARFPRRNAAILLHEIPPAPSATAAAAAWSFGADMPEQWMDMDQLSDSDPFFSALEDLEDSSEPALSASEEHELLSALKFPAPFAATSESGDLAPRLPSPTSSHLLPDVGEGPRVPEAGVIAASLPPPPSIPPAPPVGGFPSGARSITDDGDGSMLRQSGLTIPPPPPPPHAGMRGSGSSSSSSMRTSSSTMTRKSVSFSAAPVRVRQVQEPEDRRPMPLVVAAFYRGLLAQAPHNPAVQRMVQMAWEMEEGPDATYLPAELSVYRVFALELEDTAVRDSRAQQQQFEATRDLVTGRYVALLGLSEEQVQDLCRDPVRSRFAPLLPPFQGILFSRLRVGATPLVEGAILRLQTALVGSRRPYHSWYFYGGNAGDGGDDGPAGPHNDAADTEGGRPPSHYRVLLHCRTCRYIQPFLQHPLLGNRDAVSVNVQESPLYQVVGLVPDAPGGGSAGTLFLAEMGVEDLLDRVWRGDLAGAPAAADGGGADAAA